MENFIIIILIAIIMFCILKKFTFCKITLEQICNFKIKSITITEIMAFFFVVGLAVNFRYLFWSFQSGDWVECLEPWLKSMRAANGIFSLKSSITNYTTSYTFFLTLLSYLPSEIWKDIIKLLSCIFDFILALVLFKYIRKDNKEGTFIKAFLAFTITLLSPIVILNGSAWAQCDIIYTTFLVISLYFISLNIETPIPIRKIDFGYDDLAMISFGIAFSLKLQSVFLLPVFVLVSFLGYLRVKKYLWVPVCYLLSSLPALIMGRGLKNIIKIYFGQMGEYNLFTMNYPNFFTFVNNNADMSIYGICMCMTVLFCVFFYLYYKKVNINRKRLLLMTIFSVYAATFFLPHMHERYALLAEILIFVYILYDWKKWYLAIAINTVTLITYSKYLFNTQYFGIPDTVLSIIRLVILGDIINTIIKEHRNEKGYNFD